MTGPTSHIAPSLRTLAAMAMLLAVAPLPARAETAIGVDAAVNPQAVGAPPAGAPFPLEVGQPVVFNERIATTSTGRTQILFRDASTVSVGPASDLVIDQFLYDPSAGAGKLAMSATRGVFRFVGGQVSKLDNPVTLDTPSGTIGIRGGIFLASIAPDGGLTVVFVYGKELTVTGRNGAVTTLRRPGFGVSVDRAGGSPSPPFPAPRGLLGSLVGQFQGPPSATTSAAGITDASVAADPHFARLVGDVDLANRGPPIPDRGTPGMPPPRSLLNSLAGGHTLGIGSIAVQGDIGLRQVIQQRIGQDAD